MARQRAESRINVPHVLCGVSAETVEAPVNGLIDLLDRNELGRQARVGRFIRMSSFIRAARFTCRKNVQTSLLMRASRWFIAVVRT